MLPGTERQGQAGDTPVLDFTRHKPLTVILGAQRLQRREESWQSFQVKEYHCHPGFISPKKGNDILLLKVTWPMCRAEKGSVRFRANTHPCGFCPPAQLNGNATSNGQVRPISFEKSKVRGGTECTVVGWGYRTATVTILKQRDCLSHYPGLADNLVCGRSRSSVVPIKVSLLREEEEEEGEVLAKGKAQGEEDPCSHGTGPGSSSTGG